MRNEKRLQGVHEDLVRVVRDAYERNNFLLVEGVRTVERQRELVARKLSRTMNSRHITGHAVDIAPMIEGKVSWEWSDFSGLFEAMRAASIAQRVPVVWGGCWDRTIDSTVGDAVAVRDAYASRIRARGRKPFLDGPHFELHRSAYP